MNANERIIPDRVAEVGTDLGVLENKHMDPLVNALISLLRLGDTKGNHLDWERDLRPALVDLVEQFGDLQADLLATSRKINALASDIVKGVVE